MTGLKYDEKKMIFFIFRFQASLSLSVEESVALSKKFLRQMAQPFPKSAQLGISLLDADQARQFLKKLQTEATFAAR